MCLKTSLHQAAHAGDDRIEEKQEDQRTVLIEVEHPIVGSVAGGGIIVEAVQERPQQLEVLQAAELILRDRRSFGPCHGYIMRRG